MNNKEKASANEASYNALCSAIENMQNSIRDIFNRVYTEKIFEATPTASKSIVDESIRKMGWPLNARNRAKYISMCKEMSAAAAKRYAETGNHVWLYVKSCTDGYDLLEARAAIAQFEKSL